MENAIVLRRAETSGAVATIMHSVSNSGHALTVFADELVEARAIVLEGQKEAEGLSRDCLIGGVIGIGSLLGAISIGSVMAPITGLAMAVSIGYAINEYTTKTAAMAATAKEVDKLLSDATSEQWSELAELCDSPEHFAGCLKAGLLAATKKRMAHGDIYRAAVAHSDRLGKMHLPGYTPPSKTGFATPVDRKDWRATTPAQTEPSNAEFQIIGQLCNTRSGFKAVAGKVKELMQENPAAGLNLAITSAALSDRDYAKAGIPIDRLRSIKAWALAGDSLLSKPAVKPAVKPSVISIAPSVEAAEDAQAQALAIAIGETEEYTEESEEELVQEESLEQATADVIDMIVESAIVPMLIVGPSQSGKTALSGTIADALADEGFDIWFINLNYSEVSPVAALATRTATCDMDVDDVATQRSAITAANAMLKELRSARNVVMIFDEFTMACTTQSDLLAMLTFELGETISRTRSGGQKRSQGFIGIGTPCNTKDWNKNVKSAIDNLMILPLITDTVQTARGPRQAPIADKRQAVAMSEMSLETLDSEDERVIGFGGQWYGVSHLNTYKAHIPVAATVVAVKPSMVAVAPAVRPSDPEPEDAWFDEEF